MTRWIQAEDFVLSSAATLGTVQFWDVQGSTSYLGSITWSIYNDSGGSPGTQLYSANTTLVTRVLTGRNMSIGTTALAEWSDTFNINATLGAGTYWLGLHNGPLTSTARNEFYWETAATTGPNGVNAGMELNLAIGNALWSTTSQEHAFNLSIPEPATFGMVFAILLAGVCGRRFRIFGGMTRCRE
jgi:hypothetical protein